MIEYGLRPTFTSGTLEQVDGAFQFAKNEWGKAEGLKYINETGIINPTLTAHDLENESVAKIVQLFREKGGEVKYLRLSTTLDRDTFGQIIATITVEEVFFVGDPFIIDDVIVIALIIAGIIFYFLATYSPVIYHWVGISPEDVKDYQTAQLIPVIAFGALILVGLWLYKK